MKRLGKDKANCAVAAKMGEAFRRLEAGEYTLTKKSQSV